jgi:hypothetical protein
MSRVPRLSRWLIAAGPLALLLGLAPGAAAQALTRPGPPAGVLRTTYGPPAIAALGPAAGIAAGDNHGNIDYWAEVHGGWELLRVASASGGVFYNSPVIASNAGLPVLAALTSTGGLDYWYYSAAASAWVREQVASGGYSSPAITVGNGLVMITAVDSAGNLDFWSQAPGSTAWSPAQVVTAGEQGPFTVPAITWAGPYTVITAATTTGQVYSWLQWDGSTFWNPELLPASPAGRDWGYDAPVLTLTGSQVEIAAALSGDGPDQVIDLWSLPLGQTGWGAPQAVSADLGPSLAWTGSDLVMVSQDAQDNLWFAEQSGGWSPAQVAPGLGAGRSYTAPEVTSTAGCGLAVVAADHGSIYSWLRPPGASTWTPVLVAAATG